MADINNYTTDVAIWDEARTKTVSVVTDGSIQRLAIDGKITSDDSPTKYQVKVDYDATGDSVGSGADVTLFTYTGVGVIDFIGLTAGSDSYYAILDIDGVEKLRISMSDLGSQLSLSNATNVPMWADTANKNFRYYPQGGIGFTTSFAIKARSTTGTNTIKHITLYREKVA
jgi:hypothetical protein